jgi:hypothetical protein
MLLTAGGCSSIKPVESWNKPVAQAHRYQKILILGIVRDENRRRIFEDVIVAELRRNQVQAVAGHTIVPELNPDKTTRAEVVAAVRTSGCDAVLVTRPQSVGDSSVTQPGQAGFNIYGANYASAHYDFLKARLQTNMFDAATEELLWSSTVTTFDADHEVRVSRDLARFFFETLRRDGLL